MTQSSCWIEQLQDRPFNHPFNSIRLGYNVAKYSTQLDFQLMGHVLASLVHLVNPADLLMMTP